MAIPVYMNADGVSLLIGKHTYRLSKSHVNYEKVLALLRRNASESKLLPLVDVRTALDGKRFSAGKNYFFFPSDREDRFVHAKFDWAEDPIRLERNLSRNVSKVIKSGLPYENALRFASKLYQNPSCLTVSRLFSYLETYELPILENGNFFAYVRVANDFLDAETGANNSAGCVVKVPRNSVTEQADDDGLRVCPYGFLDQFFKRISDLEVPNSFDRIVTVEVNPKDVVYVPTSDESQSLKVCEYLASSPVKASYLPEVSEWVSGDHDPKWVETMFDRVVAFYRLFYAPRRVNDFVSIPDSVVTTGDITAELMEEFDRAARETFPELQPIGPLTEEDIDAALRMSVDSPKELIGLLSQVC